MAKNAVPKQRNEFMTPTSVTLQHPLDEQTASLLLRLAVTAKKQRIAMLLVGAFAREVLFYHVHGIETSISTMDTDISVHVPNWAAFHRLRTALDLVNFEIKKDIVEKIVDKASGKEVDLIPFGPVAGADALLKWPDDGPTWNVLGFDEALGAAIAIPLQTAEGEAVLVPMVTISSLVMLKIMSFYDRPKVRVKDVRDIGFVIRHYLDAGNRERLLTQPGLVALAAQKPDEAAAILLGQDIGCVACAATKKYLVDKLAHEITSKSICILARTLAHQSCKGNFPVARAWLQSLLEGIKTP
jgi:predicted nucleotidyltransferase